MQGRTTAKWMAASFGLALIIACLALWGGAAGDKVGMALRATARWSFVLFWLATTGAALTALFGPTFQWLVRRARDFGLAFASAHLVHLALVAALYQRAVSPPLSRPLLIFFSVAAVWTYIIASSSLRPVSAALAPETWRIVRRLGVEYLTLAFIIDFSKHPFGGGWMHLIAYMPFAVLAVAAPVLRLAAAAKRYHLSGANDAAAPT